MSKKIKRVIIQDKQMTKAKLQSMFEFWENFPPKSSIGLYIHIWIEEDEKVANNYINVKKITNKDYEINAIGYRQKFTSKNKMISEVWNMMKVEWAKIPDAIRAKITKNSF